MPWLVVATCQSLYCSLVQQLQQLTPHAWFNLGGCVETVVHLAQKVAQDVGRKADTPTGVAEVAVTSAVVATVIKAVN